MDLLLKLLLELLLELLLVLLLLLPLYVLIMDHVFCYETKNIQA